MPTGGGGINDLDGQRDIQVMWPDKEKDVEISSLSFRLRIKSSV
jgi:hypothetical protein